MSSFNVFYSVSNAVSAPCNGQKILTGSLFKALNCPVTGSDIINAPTFGFKTTLPVIYVNQTVSTPNLPLNFSHFYKFLMLPSNNIDCSI